MLSEPDLSHVEMLHKEFGGQPLIHLVRRLVVKIDKAPPSSKARGNIVRSLNILTGQGHLGEDMGAWMDWLETQDENSLRWDALPIRKGALAPPSPEVVASETLNPVAAVPPAPPAPTTTSAAAVTVLPEPPPAAPARQRVVLEPEPRPANFKMPPLTKEQALWDKALKRAQNNQRSRSKLVMALVVLLIMGALSYLGWQYKDEAHGLWTRVTTKTQPVVVAPAAPPESAPAVGDPKVLWGSFALSADYNPPWADEGALAEFSLFIRRNGPEQPITSAYANTPREQPLFWNNTLWLDLWSQESMILGPDILPEEGRTRLDLENFSPGKKTYQWVRLDRKQRPVLRGFQHEQLARKGNLLEISIRRVCGNEGAAHRLQLGTLGLVGWAWRCRFRQAVVEGRVARQKSRCTSTAIGTSWSTPRASNFSAGQVILPAVVSPLFQGLEDMLTYQPLANRFLPVGEFAALEPAGKPGCYRIVSRDGEWSELWTPVSEPAPPLAAQ